MSKVLYKTNNRQYTNDKYTVIDEIFSFSSELSHIWHGNNVIVIFSDFHDKFQTTLDQQRSYVSLDDICSLVKGAFSIVIYDRSTKRVSVFRSLTADPIFYHHSHEQLIISDQLASLNDWSRDLDENYFRLYLHTELTETEYTPYIGVRRLLPGHKLVKNNDRPLYTEKFWAMQRSIAGNNRLSIEDCIDNFSDILHQIVEESVSDQQVIGCEVSGGLDSSSVSCIASKRKNENALLYGFTYLFDNSHDGKSNQDRVEIIYQHTGMMPEYIGLSNYWSFKDVASDITHFDEPSSLILNFAMFRDLSHFAKAYGIDILLSGEGGDEILAASAHYLRDLLFQGKVSQVLSQIIQISAQRKQPVWKVFSTHILPALLPNRWEYRLESRICKPSWENTGFYLNWYDTPAWIGEKLSRITYEEVESERRKVRDANISGMYLQDNFERLVLVNPCTWLNNNIGKPCGLRRIYPFRDQRLIEFLFSLPSSTKLEISKNKQCIRMGLQNVIPQEILTKPDQSRFGEIFRKGFEREANFVNELVQTSHAAEFGWIGKDTLVHAMEKFRYGCYNEIGLIAKTLGLELWLRHHGY